jgi:hypothetical protein
MATTSTPSSSADGAADKRTALLVVAQGVMGAGVIWLAKQEERA